MGVDIEAFDEVKKVMANLSEEAKAKVLSSIKAYVEFTELDPVQLIEEAKADKLASNPKYVAEERLYLFFGNLLTKQHVEQNTAISIFNDIRRFYRKNGIALDVSIPRALRYAKYKLGAHVVGIDWLG